MKFHAKSALALIMTALMALSSSAPAIAVSDADAQNAQSSAAAATTAGQYSDAQQSDETARENAVSSMKEQINNELTSDALPERMNGAAAVTTTTTTTTTTEEKTVTDTGSADSSLSDTKKSSEQTDADETNEAEQDQKEEKHTQILPYGISMKELCPQFATGDTTTQGSFPDDIDVTRTSEDYYAAKYGESSRYSLRAVNFPASVDNSQSPYFPEVDSQGSIGSCTCWSQVYYQFTYTFNKSRGIKTTPQNTFSPMFTYSHINGSVDSGSASFDAYTDMTKFGCATLEEVPYGKDYLNINATADIFRKAANRRVKDYHSIKSIGDGDAIITSVDDPDLEPFKTVLMGGDIISMTSGITCWRLGNLKDPKVSGVNEGAVGDVVVLCNDGGNGGHRMTIVGYNDNIWTDLNNNDKIDSGEMGAFKIVNSWGKGVGTNGFYWIPYDTVNKKSVVENSVVYPDRQSAMTEYTWMEVMPVDYVPRYFLNIDLSTAEKGDKSVKVIGKWANSTYSTPAVTGISDHSQTYHSFDGTQNESEGVFVWDVKYVMDKLGTDRFDEIEWSIEYKDSKANGRPLTVKNTYFYDEKESAVKFAQSGFPFTVENSSKTIVFNTPVHNNAIIYYRGYKEPVIRYKLGSTWSDASGKAMSYTLEEHGYVYKYVIPMGTESSVLVMFGDGKGNWDTNNGRYYKAVKDLNHFATEGVAEPMVLEITHYADEVSDLDTIDSLYGITTGGYAPYRYRVEIIDTKDGSTFFSNEYGKETAYSASVNNGSIKFTKESKFKVIIYSMDVTGTETSQSYTITIKDMPFRFNELSASPGKTIYQSGDEIVLTATDENDKLDPGDCNFMFAIYKDGILKQKNSIRPKSYNMYGNRSTAYLTFNAGEAGKYTAVVSRTNKAKELAFKTLEFEVAAPAIKLSSVTVNPETNIGTGGALTVKAAATGATGAVTYNYSLQQYGAIVLTSDITAAEATLTVPEKSGPYTVVVTAKDENGASACYTKDIWVNPVSIKSITFPSSGLYNRSDIKISSTVRNDGGLSAANYFYTAVRNGKETLLKTNADKTATLNMADAGEYTIRLDIKSGDKVLVSSSKKLTLAENPVPADHKIRVAVISYIENEGSQSSYQLHYWNNNNFIGDAVLKATGETVSKSVGNAYWGGAAQTFTVYEASVPLAATGYKFHIGNRWFGDDGNISTSNTVYIFNYSGDKALYTTE